MRIRTSVFLCVVSRPNFGYFLAGSPPPPLSNPYIFVFNKTITEIIYGLKKYNIIQIPVIIHAAVNDHSSHYSTTCTTRTCIEYDYMHMHVVTTLCSELYRVFIPNMTGNRYKSTKIKLILAQNYGWPTGPAKIWLWLARRPFGWPRASGKHDPC